MSSPHGMTPLFEDSPTRDTTLEREAASTPRGHKIDDLVGSDDGPMFEAMQRSAADGLAWIARNPEDERPASPPTPASSSSTATLRVQAGVRAALVGWQAGRTRR